MKNEDLRSIACEHIYQCGGQHVSPFHYRMFINIRIRSLPNLLITFRPKNRRLDGSLGVDRAGEVAKAHSDSQIGALVRIYSKILIPSAPSMEPMSDYCFSRELSRRFSPTNRRTPIVRSFTDIFHFQVSAEFPNLGVVLFQGCFRALIKTTVHTILLFAGFAYKQHKIYEIHLPALTGC